MCGVGRRNGGGLREGWEYYEVLAGPTWLMGVMDEVGWDGGEGEGERGEGGKSGVELSGRVADFYVDEIRIGDVMKGEVNNRGDVGE